MTNAERYLKDGVVQNIDDFFKQQAKPTLTEDEKVVLRNIKKDYKYIGKIKFLGVEVLYVSQKEKAEDFTTLSAFDHLFQFIKERRRI